LKVTEASPAAVRREEIDSVVVWAEHINAASKALSPRVLGMVVEHLDADTLSNLAAIRRAREREGLPRLPAAAVEQLAVMLTDRRTPTIGWWRRRLARRGVVA